MGSKKIIIIISAVAGLLTFAIIGKIVLNKVIASSVSTNLSEIQTNAEKKKAQEEKNEALKKEIAVEQAKNNNQTTSNQNNSNNTQSNTTNSNAQNNTNNSTQSNTTNSSSSNNTNNNSTNSNSSETNDEKITRFNGLSFQKGNYLYNNGARILVPDGFAYAKQQEEPNATVVMYINHRTYATFGFLVMDNPAQDGNAMYNNMDSAISILGLLKSGPLEGKYGNNKIKIYGVDISGASTHAYVTATDSKIVFMTATGGSTLSWMKPSLISLSYY